MAISLFEMHAELLLHRELLGRLLRNLPADQLATALRESDAMAKSAAGMGMAENTPALTQAFARIADLAQKK